MVVFHLTPKTGGGKHIHAGSVAEILTKKGDPSSKKPGHLCLTRKREA